MASPDPAKIEETLAQAAETLEADLQGIFEHPSATARVETGPPHRLIVEGDEGRFVVTWPPGEGMTEAEGPLGAHARIALEFLLAAETPEAFFDGFRPQTEHRRELLFNQVEAYIDDSLRENPYYTPLITERRGAAMLVYGDDEYTLVAEDGNYRGNGILHWKVKRLVAFALTDVDELIFDDDPAGASTDAG